MKVLGISEIDNDAGAVLFVDGELTGAASEERFSRRKMHAGFPHRAIDWLLRQARLRPRDLDFVVVVKPEPADEEEANLAHLRRHRFRDEDGPRARRWLNALAWRGWRVPRNRREIRRYGRQVADWLGAAGVAPARVVRAQHHRAHAASAFFASGFDRALAVTCDGQGGGVSASVYRCHGASMELRQEIRTPHSLGFFYAMVTRALGFRPARHEGKVTGLAAHAVPDPEALALLREVARSSDDGFVTPGLYGLLPALRRLAITRGRAPVAAAAQQVLEEVVTAWVGRHLEATGERNLALAGGVFANVRLNQRLHRLGPVERIFVFPHMGDGGLGYGGVVGLLGEVQGRKSQAIGDVYWGPEPTEGEMEAALIRAGLDYEFVDKVEERLVEELLGGRTVARFAGRMEFGPRALGNRSVLAAADDRRVVEALNRKLERSDFMPFAPVVLADEADTLFTGLAGAERAAEFMTICLDASRAMCEQVPAVVHLDGTARPQLLRSGVNPSYQAVVEGYRRASGRPALINTSFNRHEEPIVSSPDDAVRTFLACRLDVLALGRLVTVRKI